MRRFTVSLAVVVVLLVGAIASMGRSTTAQEDMTAEHPIVGAWEWDNDPDHPGTDISYAIFHDDGTYTELNGNGTINIGAWEPTGERTADLTARNLFIDPDTNETFRGTLLLAAEVDETGNSITAPFTFEARNTDGEVVFAGEFLAIGTRIDVVPMVPLGTPMAGTPTS
jgi:hypothetical protein